MLTNLKLTASDGVELSEIYPPQLPDLFHGGQLVVMGRYTGKGPAAIKLDRQGRQGDRRSSSTSSTSPTRRATTRTFVEDLWARRKVGYPARPDPRQRREEGTGGRGDDPGQEVRHHHAVHQLSDRARRHRADRCPQPVRPPHLPVARRSPGAGRRPQDGARPLNVADFAKKIETNAPQRHREPVVASVTLVTAEEQAKADKAGDKDDAEGKGYEGRPGKT